ncbi:MAG: response regulator [Gemmatimonadaceae bacterium]|nr:response regulator [Gemmatimonadaceae bacterium]
MSQLSTSEFRTGRRRARAWWADSLVLMTCTLLAELALHEAVETSSAFISPSARGWVDAIALSIIIGPLFGWTLYRRHVDAKYARVPDTKVRVPGSPHGKVRMVLNGALLVFGVLIAGALWAHLATLDRSRATAEFLNIAGRQRAHSQRIARLAVEFDRQHVDSAQLVAALGWMQKDATHFHRRVRDAAGADSARRTPSLQSSHDERQALVAATQALIAGTGSVADVKLRADQLLSAAETVVDRLTLQQQEVISQQHRGAWVVALLMLACVVGIMGLVLEPVVRLLRRQHVAITSRSLEFERLAMVAERTSNAVVITDAEWRINWINESFTRLTGYSFNEVKGKMPGPLLDAPGNDPEMMARMAQAAADGEPVRLTLQNRRRDGSTYWLNLAVEPLFEGSKLSGFIAVHSDITNLVHATEALSKERETLARTTDQLREAQAVARLGSWSLDLANDHLEWSPETFVLFGRDPELGPPPRSEVVDLYAPEDTVRLREAAVNAYTNGTSYSIVIRTAGLNPDVRWIRAEGRARYAEDGAIVGLIGIAVDVTESIEREEALRLAQARAEAASQSKSEFLANMSHEIRTPLTAILGYTDLLRDEARQSGATADQLGAMDTIRRAGEHLLTVINDILDISKIEAGRLAVETLPTDLPAVLLDVESLMRARAAQKGVSLECRLMSPVPTRVLSDPTRLRQILMNLVGNAAKFTDRGRVLIEAGVETNGKGETLVVAVDDTGPGMTEEQVAHLFQPFMQADTSVTRRFGGTGLGLTISRRLAQLMGGDVELTQTALGRGSRFEVRLPLTEAEGSARVTRLGARPVTPMAVPTAVTLRGHILLAEDGEDNQRLISLLLRAAGAQVTVVRHGREALEAIDWARQGGAPFDALVTDMQMPEMDGYTLARTLRNEGNTIPVIALTAHAMAEDRQRCLDAGCDDYASKPIDRAALLATVARWLPADNDVFPQVTTPTASIESDTPQQNAAGNAQEQTVDTAPTVLISELANDPDLGEVVRVFAEALPDRVAALVHAVRTNDLSETARQAHQLKGAAGSYGFPVISTLARTFETHTRAGDLAAAHVTLERLQQHAAAAWQAVQPEELVMFGGAE